MTRTNGHLVHVGGLVKHFPIEGSDDVVRAVDGDVVLHFSREKRWDSSVSQVVASRQLADVSYD